MQSRFFFSIRYKIMIAFFAIGFASSALLGIVAYNILEERLFQQLRSNIGNITHLGAALLDRDAVLYLTQNQSPADLPAAQRDSVESSQAFKTIYAQLNFIRDSEKDLIRYVYLLTPTDDPEITRYLADADVLKLKEQGAATDDISHFNSILDVADFPVLQKAVIEKKNIVEDEYVFDQAYGINSVSGYAPVMAEDGKTMLALLGIDMAASEVQAALAEVLQKSILVAAIAMLISIITAIVMGALMTRGVIMLDRMAHSFANKDFAARAQFRSNDEIGRLGISFNSMAGTIEEYSVRLEALVAAYGRFFPHDILRLLDKKSILDLNLGDQTQREMSVLFSDIRNFTTLSESMTPKENFDFINSYLRRVGPQIRAHQGIIDKYLGDAVMALFPDSAEQAIDAALKMQAIVLEYNRDAQTSSLPEIRIGVGIHTGKVMLGTIGEPQRMDGTVISDAVNLASRVESLTKRYDCKIMVTGDVLTRIKNRNRYFTRFIDRVCVAGKNDPVNLHEICDADSIEDIQNKKRTFNDYNLAIERYFARDFDQAEALLSGITAQNPNDVPAALWLEKTRDCLKKGVPAGWDGVTRLDSK